MISNLIRTARNLASGRYMATLKSYYDPRFPPTKFFSCAADRPRVKCILSGFPRTGTHWVRNVIHRSTGLSTYSVATKGPLPSDGNGFLVKVHARNKFIARWKALWLLPRHDFDGAYIYTYRDPRDAILSLYEMYKLKKDRQDLSQPDFLDMYDPIGQYKWEIRAWVMHEHKNVLQVRFEDLQRDPLVEFQRIFRYLGLEGIVNEDSLGEPVAKADGSNRPRRTAFAWKIAPAEYAPLIELVSARLKKEISALDYETA